MSFYLNLGPISLPFYLFGLFVLNVNVYVHKHVAFCLHLLALTRKPEFSLIKMYF